MRHVWFRILLVFAATLVAGAPGTDARAWAEKPGVQSSSDKETTEASASGSGIGTWFVGFYRNHISPVDGDRCPSTPSCSSYSLQAIRKHGVFVGWMMTVDRLIHEGKEEARVSPVVQFQGRWRIYDPVENNDFWWHAQDGRGHE